MVFDSASARMLADRLIGPELIVYPVRHHSPACAWYLRALIAECAPSVVLVEGPRSFDALIPLLAHADAKMPVAIYTYAAGRAEDDAPERRSSAYYPFCDYSPELVALREAARRGVPAKFIDLDFDEQCSLDATQDDDERSLLDERHYRRSLDLQALATALGCRDHEELWEHLFETDVGGVGWREHLARVAAYCMLSRAGIDDDALAADGTLQREAEMHWHVRDAVAKRDPASGPVLAVMGGFHAVAMPALSDAPPPRPQVKRSGTRDTDAALIRYSFDRLDRLNGYAAGMTSPGWHQSLWDRWLRCEPDKPAWSSRMREQVALETLMEIAIELRSRHGIALAMPTLAAAHEQTLRLCALRGRTAPVRDDVLDAVTSCFVKGDVDGDGAIVLGVARRVLCGDRMGTVPPGAHTPPLVRDVAWRLRRQRLKVDDASPRRTALELYRRPAHRTTSRLLHGLAYLGIPFAVRMSGPDFIDGAGLDRLQEHWEYAYSAATEAALVEASVHGATLPAAVAHRFAQQLERMRNEGLARDARTAAAMLTRACVLGLHDHVPKVLGDLRRAIGEDASFEAVVAALGRIALLWESREPLEARGLDDIPSLVQAGYECAMFLGHALRGRGADADAVVVALTQLRELLISQVGKRLDAALYWSLLAVLQQRHDAAQVRGAIVGLRYSAGALEDAQLQAAVDGHFLGATASTDAVAFLRGVLQTAREAAWQQPVLLQVLDARLCAWTQADFVTHLPELRLAFSQMTPRETDRIAEAVAGLHGLNSIGPLVQRAFDADDVQRHLDLSERVVRLLTADGLGGWVCA